MSNQKILTDVYDEWYETVGVNPGAVFTDLKDFISTGQSLPWGDGGDIANILDIEYIGNISGEKTISPVFEKLLKAYPANQIMAVRGKIAKIVLLMYLDKWQKSWDTLNFEYNPIENYSMLEQLSDDERKKYYGKSSTRTDNLTSRNAGTSRQDPNLTETENNNVYGFNSTAVDGEPSEKRTRTQTGNTINTVDASVINTGTQSLADGGSDREEHSYTLTRTGNIGTVTAQDMIEQERKILLWNYFYQVVFPDLDRVLTIQIY